MAVTKQDSQQKSAGPSNWNMRSCALLMALVPLGGGETARYRLTVDNSWSPQTHPGAFPTPDAHFAWMAGATHGPAVSFWDLGQLASPGMVQMAETGGTTILQGEVAAAVTAGTAGAVLYFDNWFCPAATSDPLCGPLVNEFEIDQTHSQVTLVTMIGPSPDWFVGVSGLELRDSNGWLDQVVVDLRPYDGGTRDANVFALFGPQTTPPDPITLITTQTGQLIGPGSLGSFTFERLVDEPEPYCAGKPSSSNCLASMQAELSSTPGVPTASAPVSGANDYRITVVGAQGLRPGILFGSTAGQATINFQGGTLCVQPPLKRSVIQFTGGTNGACDGGYGLVVNTGISFPPPLPGGFDAGPGGTSYYQAWYRDPVLMDGFDVALSNAIEIDWML